MTELTVSDKQLPTIKTVETAMLKEEQVKCPVVHHFGGGIYIREVKVPKDSLSMGHHQNFKHMNVFLSGQLVAFQNGTETILKSPMISVGNPGRKFGYVLEDMVWLNVYPTTETDVEKLEVLLFTKSEEWKQTEKDRLAKTRQEDNDDYKEALKELEVSEEQVWATSSNMLDQIPTPEGSWKFIIQQSTIHGKGVFATADINANELISPTNIFGKRTPVGRYANHAKTPNAKMILINNDTIWLIAKSDINGCTGGQIGEEITVDYRQSVQIRRQLCQELQQQ